MSAPRSLYSAEWPKESVEELTRLRRQGLPAHAIAERMGKTYSSINKKCQALIAFYREQGLQWPYGVDAPLPAPAAPAAEAYTQTELPMDLPAATRLEAGEELDPREAAQLLTDFDRLRAGQQRLRDRSGAIAKVDRERFRLENGMEGLTQVAREMAHRWHFEPMGQRPAASEGRERTDMSVHFTDVHGFEKVKAAHVMNVNDATATTFGDRVQAVTEQAIQRIEETARIRDMRRVGVLWGGDWVSGLIHELDRYSTDNMDPISVTLNVGALMARATNDIANACHALGIEVIVVGICGNHGRLRADMPMQNTNAPRESLDWVAMAFAAALLEDSQIAMFHLPDSLYALVELCGKVCMLTHGDFLEPGKVPAERLDKTRVKLAIALDTPIEHAFAGHFHIAQAHEGKSFICPSLKGTDSYAFNGLHVSNDPAQAIYFVTPNGCVQELLYANVPLRTAPRYRFTWTDTVTVENPPEVTGPVIAGRGGRAA